MSSSTCTPPAMSSSLADRRWSMIFMATSSHGLRSAAARERDATAEWARRRGARTRHADAGALQRVGGQACSPLDARVVHASGVLEARAVLLVL
mmetsp:Transcript_11943/g.31396  ORF Transcript_11943/g.31396 Transcript_11943/m.31396 type:complete len:94 (-) Transcript_11943:9-290(-)